MSDKKNEELEIETKDELDDMSHDEFDVDEGANFKVEEKNQDHTQQEDHHSPSKNVQNLPQHEN
jgi:hypothetical protein